MMEFARTRGLTIPSAQSRRPKPDVSPMGLEVGHASCERPKMTKLPFSGLFGGQTNADEYLCRGCESAAIN